MTIDGDYTYVGFRSSYGLIYIKEMTIEWEVPLTPPTISLSPSAPYFDGDEVESLACTLNNGSKHNIQLTRVEIYSDLKMLSFTNYNEKSGALAVGDSKKVSFEGLKGKGDKFGFTVVWYYTFNGEKFTYRCEYTL